MGRLFSRISLAAFIGLAALVVTVFVLPCLPAQAASAPECWAVFVGISSYKDSVSCTDLYYSDDDAKEFSQALGAAWGTTHTQMLINSQATKSNILDAIDWLAENAGNDDLVVFTFSGHGAPGGYLCAYDSNAYSSTYDISAYELAQAFKSVHAAKTVFILENCYAGAFENSLAGNGRVILMGSRANEVGWVYHSLSHFVYGYYILEAFGSFNNPRNIGVDTNNDWELSAEEIARYAGPWTTQYEENQDCEAVQHPIFSDGYPGELALLAKFVFDLNIKLPYGTDILTLDGKNYKTVPSYLLWVPGVTHTMSVPDIVDKGTGTRYVFTSWDDGTTSVSRSVSKGSYTASYDKEQFLEVVSALGSPRGGGWYKDGSTAAFSVTPKIELSDTRHYFTGWTGDYSGTQSSASLVMDAPKTVTANWRHEYLLTVNSQYGQPTGAGWYNQGDEAGVSVEPSQGFLIRQIFTGWSGDLTGTSPSAGVNMNSPKVITANWRTDFIQLYILIGGVVVLVGAAAAAFILIKRHKKAVKKIVDNLSR